MNLAIGDKAPDFSLYSDEKQLVTLSEQLGHNVLLLFFPLAFTSVCTAELCGIRDHLSRYQKLNARVFAISVDSPQTLHRYKQDQNLNFLLLSDFNKDVSKLYNSLYETFSMGMKGVSKRAAFVIDSQGFIRYTEILENAGLQPDFQSVEKVLKEITGS